VEASLHEYFPHPSDFNFASAFRISSIFFGGDYFVGFHDLPYEHFLILLRALFLQIFH